MTIDIHPSVQGFHRIEIPGHRLGMSINGWLGERLGGKALLFVACQQQQDFLITFEIWLPVVSVELIKNWSFGRNFFWQNTVYLPFYYRLCLV